MNQGLIERFAEAFGLTIATIQQEPEEVDDETE